MNQNLIRLLELKEGQQEPTAAQKKNAAAEIEAFLKQLRSLRILDPACGSGNFLYVTLDLLKSLEAEVVTRLVDVVGKVQLSLEQINPSQFLGIEINPRAAAIAELVIWIGYLQWHFKRFGTAAPPEPILQKFNNIEYRDAVLAYDGKEPDIDPVTKQPRTRWGGGMMKHPVTGENVPDPSDQIPIYRYINPRPAKWTDADYVVSNPPFVGNKRMRLVLGDDYVEALRTAHNDVPEASDLVMYWWNYAAKLLQKGRLQCFGFITTNSITQPFNRRVLQAHLSGKIPISLVFAIPDHPWIDSTDGAAVRIAMTVVERGSKQGILAQPVKEEETEYSSVKVYLTEKKGIIHANLSVGANVLSVSRIASNAGLSGQGVIVLGDGFLLDEQEYQNLLSNEPFGRKFVKRYCNGKDITHKSRQLRIIDLYGLTESQLREYPHIYQRIYERVRPKRLQMKDRARRENWWLFGRSNQEIRNAINGLNCYIATCRTAKHRVFVFLDGDILPDAKLIAIGSDDAFHLGVLSSKPHLIWALKTGAFLEDRPNYNHSDCFGTFPFPDPNLRQQQKIREVAEKLDTHRKRVQAQHPDVTITGMYNLLEKLRAGQPFTDKDREYNDQALVSTLKQIHAKLDAAVLDAYGWHQDISDEEILERLVALNAERAEEERNGLIRWLRPEYQAPDEVRTQQVIAGVIEPEEVAVAPAAQKTWAKKPKDQLAAIRDLLLSSGGEWTVDQVAAQFNGAQRQKKAIAENLERLEWFGILISREEGGIVRWQFAQMQQAA